MWQLTFVVLVLVMILFPFRSGWHYRLKFLLILWLRLRPMEKSNDLWEYPYDRQRNCLTICATRTTKERTILFFFVKKWMNGHIAPTAMVDEDVKEKWKEKGKSRKEINTDTLCNNWKGLCIAVAIVTQWTHACTKLLGKPLQFEFSFFSVITLEHIWVFEFGYSFY